MTYLAGIDVGTGSIKALLYDAERGSVVAVTHRATPLMHPRPEWSEFEPKGVWDAVTACLREIVGKVPAGGTIASVAVASMGESGVPLDASGRILDSIIAWYDQRTEPQAEWWAQTLGAQRIYEITGHAISPVFSINKLMWLREHRPIVFAAMERWLCMEDFVLWKLSGEYATDYSLASRTMAFDQARLEWSDTILRHAGVPREILPDAAPSGTRIGTVTTSAAAETGLPAGAVVATGGHDHLCGAFAAGMTSAGSLLDSTGTAESLLLLRDRFVPSAQLLAHTNNQYAYVVPGLYVVTGALTAAGGLFRWWVERFWGDDPSGYEKALAEAAESPAGARGVFCLPHLIGSGTPHSDGHSRAALVGLNDSHRRGDVLRAVLEGLGYWLRECIDELGTIEPQTASEVIGIGGATRSPLWMQIKSDVSGRHYRVPELEEAVALGAALLAGVGAGVYGSYQEAANSVRSASITYAPDAERAVAYGERYAHIYRQLYPSLTSVNQEIHRLFAT